MERFIIEGGYQLQGHITPAGNKNAALPLIAATLLTDQEIVLHNIPQIGDVKTKVALLKSLGIEVKERDDHTWAFRAKNIDDSHPEITLSRKIRTSVLLAGPMLARRGYVTLPRPGGDQIGRRRLDTHFQALQALGVSIEITPTAYEMRADRLCGADIFLDEMSVTGTEQAILAAVLAEGTTGIANAASEPHVQDLCHCLNQMGAKISGIGTNCLMIEGVNQLHGTEYTIGPDYMEVASFIGLAAVTKSELRIVNARPRDHRMTQLAFHKLGVTWHTEGEDIIVPAKQHLEVQRDAHGAIPKIDSAPWPGFNTDLLITALLVATQAHGTVLIHEKMFENRLFFVDRLISMGAQIVLCDPHRAVVAGPSQLYGDHLSSPDIRAGMSLVSAALCAKGRSVIDNIGQIDRGYERIEQRLQSLGAQIERV
ncbi:MAG: UDP-N-acetylglucosamine 1-carboxyvinyltransferase [Chloroflexi bacterium AL-W]|nr:UDP-N-acetylglucosamine 1-carboxyvinyltransferase [Chloroflexi bacterium AL-N1]NOK69940.1 UDP-N-acetylglucosamine 1-carboxyvinyltransferase [Chloroflexi bacterium AL-N10]NOK73764.1 UDP-N-acetylglucosamine 1-carboxyvinyltransferase [Chloroflexi bacterium AL-N5]NOK85472.1 UDP-N-acetylglucosamine 1-carboxyvinyltransferase [Chloroflexi bacterium AL-W]NOK91673.1 UDP-N-acetylglucosamine 1-carboxyvinyltransferase [Chloroflexi bacterium AL-N15]